MGEIPPHCHLRSQEGIRSPLLWEQIDKDLKEDGKRSKVMLLTIVIYNVQGEDDKGLILYKETKAFL